MHVVFVVRDGSFRFVESIADEVIRRGGEVTFITKDSDRLLRKMDGTLAAAVAVVEGAQYNTAWSGSWLRVTRELRSYLHWLANRAQPDFLLRRWLDYLPGWLRRLLVLGRRLGLDWLMTGRGFSLALSWFEESTMPSRNITQHIKCLRPDLVLITPLIYPDAWEVEYLKACLKLGQRHVGLVASWDNLTSKGVFHVRPALVLVWNGIQVQEAMKFHSIPEASIVPIGAPVFDWMFSHELAQSREIFCGSVGLDPARPYVLYAVSSAINCGDETSIVQNLHRHLESLAPAQIQILVRPHPNNRSGWERLKSTEIRVASLPATVERRIAKTDLFNTLYHSAAVVGLNTSVLLEAAVLDRPGLTLLFHNSHNPGLKKHVEFPHFQYLLDGAFLDVVENEQACAESLIEIVRDNDQKREARAAFVCRFLRPHGLESSASSVAVDFFERLVLSSSPLNAEELPTAAVGLRRPDLPA